MVVISGLAIRAGSIPSRLASMGMAHPSALARMMVQYNEMATTKATVQSALLM